MVHAGDEGARRPEIETNDLSLRLNFLVPQESSRVRGSTPEGLGVRRDFCQVRPACAGQDFLLSVVMCERWYGIPSQLGNDVVMSVRFQCKAKFTVKSRL